MNKRIITDIVMIMILPLLMAYSLIGENYHEILGTIIFILFIIHHINNINWLKSLNKGKYNLKRIIQTTINITLLLLMFIQPISGMLMSKYLYTFINIDNISHLTRNIHMVLAYWGFVLMSIHAGTHIGMFINKIRNNNTKRILEVCIGVVGVYGIIAFIKRKLYEYMFMKTMFVYFDFNEPLILFFIDYISIMIMFMIIGKNINKLK